VIIENAFSMPSGAAVLELVALLEAMTTGLTPWRHHGRRPGKTERGMAAAPRRRPWWCGQNLGDSVFSYILTYALSGR
jgi:hypothetical protein